YDDFAISKHGKIAVDEIRPMNKTLVAGIAKPGFFFDHLKNPGDAILEFADHHDFGQVDIDKIQSGPKPIITTEKDFMRLKGKLPSKQLYYLPIRQSFTGGGDRFDSKIIAFCKSYENPPTPCA